VRRALLLLVFALAFAGCRGTRVNVMGWEPNRRVAASSELSGEEKAGVIVVLAVAIGGAVAGVLALD